MISRLAFCLCLIIPATALMGCASTPRPPMGAPLQWSLPAKRVLLLEPRVALWETPLSGEKQQRDDWNKTARSQIEKQTQSVLMTKRIALVVAAAPANGQAGYDVSSGCTQSQSETCGKLREQYQADYAVAISVTDTYDSSGNAAAKGIGKVAQVIGIGLLGVVEGPLAPCLQFPDNPICANGRSSATGSTTISVIDLRSGAIAWSNNLDAGDWRGDSSAKTAAQKLFLGSPF